MISSFTPRHVVVVGDLMVDEYIRGTVTRVSPEAPIPVLEFGCTQRMPGGAANVALNLAGLGNEVHVLGVVGPDEAGEWLRDSLRDEGIQVDGVVVDKSRLTTQKVRYGTPQQGILRVDYEDRRPIEPDVSTTLSARLLDAVGRHHCEAVLVSDYGKGVLGADRDNDALLTTLGRLAGNGMLTGVDTKKVKDEIRAFSKFTFLKPNLRELERAVGRQVRTQDDLWDACRELSHHAEIGSIVVTLGEDGMAVYTSDRGEKIPTMPCSVFDVTGAGDTAFATIGTCLANGLDWLQAAKMANLAASVVIGSRGTRVITQQALAERIETVALSSPSYFLA